VIWPFRARPPARRVDREVSDEAAAGAGEDLRRFLIESPTQILHVLRAIGAARELVTVHFDRGRGFLITAIEQVDAARGQVVIGLGVDPALNARLLASDRLVMVSMHEHVKVQFSAAGARALHHEGRPAFAIAVPPELLRVQRREYHRVRASMREPILVRLALGGGEVMEINVVDISVGGFAGHGVLPRGKDSPGLRFPMCTLRFRDGSGFSCEVELRSVTPHRLRGGASTSVLGFGFLNLSQPAEKQLQRYVLGVERERRRAAGEGLFGRLSGARGRG
jgi:c-di-GMP-binding flagellar brake protein YcgR